MRIAALYQPLFWMAALGTSAVSQPRVKAPSSLGTVMPRGMQVTTEPEVMPLSRVTREAVYAQQSYDKRIAVTIGISAYPGRPWAPLRAATTDARHMGDRFRAMGFDHIEAIEDDAATRIGILDVLERQLPQMVGDRDLVVVFFAGHGATDGDSGYIVPQDGNGDLATSAISAGTLRQLAMRLRARHVLFLLDACFSGAMFEVSVPQRDNGLSYWKSVAQDRVVQIITAGRANESAQERDGWGYFTRALDAGLSGGADQNKDGVTTGLELAAYSSARVVTDSASRQHPQSATVEGTGTVLLLDVRRIPASQRLAKTRALSSVVGLEEPLRYIHERMKDHDWVHAEQALRDLMIRNGHSELRLLLAEVYLYSDALANANLFESELQRAASQKLTPEQQWRLVDLRALHDKALSEAR